MNKKLKQDADGQWWHCFPNGSRVRASERTCEQCHESFFAYRPYRFCSTQCRAAARGVPVPSRRCERCNREFWTREKGQRYCSHTCAAFVLGERVSATTTHETSVKNADNPRYYQDANGQWWYQPGGSKQHARSRAHVSKCPECGQDFLKCIYHRHAVYCSRSCALTALNRVRIPRSGESHHSWKGGKIRRRGYVFVLAPDYPPFAGTQRRYVAEHRLVMEQTLGRLLVPGETIHHKNGIRDDNRPDNLELWLKAHRAGQRVSDLIEYIAEYHRETMRMRLAA